MPGIKFPFPSIVAFNNGRNGGGMEFPMMINDGSLDVWENTVSLTAHELAHQYFPFYVGTNEKKYAFMDEAWAVMLPFKFMEKLAGINSRLISTVSNYEHLAGTEDDIPPMIPSLALTYPAYRNSAYGRSSIAYEILREMLGDEIFLKALQEFIVKWKSKHPTPFDFYFTFNKVTGQDLNWFWNPWFFENGYPDLAIDKVATNDGEVEITIRKVGDVPTPVKLKVSYANETSEEFYFNAGIWKDGNEIFITKIKLSDILKEVQLGDLRIPDSNHENNLFIVH
jgi:aminopeptidase N